MSTAWHVVHTQPNGEERAVANLARQGFTSFLPVYRRRIRHARRVSLVARPLFPRYLFVQFDADAAPWRSISGTFGVSNLLCRGERPLAVPAGVVEAIQTRVDAEGYVRLGTTSRFAPGQRLQITEGAFALATGLFESMTDGERVVLLLDLLGRHVRVSVPAEVVAAA